MAISFDIYFIDSLNLNNQFEQYMGGRQNPLTNYLNDGPPETRLFKEQRHD